MKINKKISIILTILILPFLIGCESEKDLRNWMVKTESARIEALRESEVVPYRNEQFTAFKSYFKEINILATSLKEDGKRLKRLNMVLKKMDLEEVCSQIFMGITDWKLIAKNCTKNRFFLCSEEVRAYPEAVKVLREILSEDQKVRFDQTLSCKNSIEVN